MPPTRLILHAGTPKTGTTSLQIVLESLRAELLREGIYFPSTKATAYPAADGAAGVKPKHQWIVNELMADDSAEFDRRMESFISDAPPSASRIFISTEGLYHHWWDFSAAGHAALAALARTHRVELWLWLREPVSFFLSNYVQMLKNPRRTIECYGSDWSPERMFDDDWFRRKLDYGEFLRSAETVFGRNGIRVFPYRGSTVTDCFEALGLRALAPAEPKEHRTLGAWAVEQLRALNREGVPPKSKLQAVLEIQAEEERLGKWRPLEISPTLRRRIVDHCEEGLDYLHRCYGVTLGEQVE